MKKQFSNEARQLRGYQLHERFALSFFRSISYFITDGAKLLSADWLRQRAIFLIKRVVLVIKRAWLLDPDWFKALSNDVIAKICC